MENLPRVIAAYKTMDQRRKQEALDYMERIAVRYPAQNQPRRSPKVRRGS